MLEYRSRRDVILVPTTLSHYGAPHDVDGWAAITLKLWFDEDAMDHLPTTTDACFDVLVVGHNRDYVLKKAVQMLKDAEDDGC